MGELHGILHVGTSGHVLYISACIMGNCEIVETEFEAILTTKYHQNPGEKYGQQSLNLGHIYSGKNKVGAWHTAKEKGTHMKMMVNLRVCSAPKL